MKANLMRRVICSVAIAVAVASCSTTESNMPIKDAAAAIQKARYICRLEQPSRTGQWQAVLVKDSWHVWFGTSPAEPMCGFFGAYVEADGSFTGCVVSACKDAPSTSKQ